MTRGTLLGPKSTLALWAFFVVVFLASLPNRFAHLDDAWLGEQAYWLYHEGLVRSDLFSNYRDWGERIWVHHKLFVPQGAASIACFGWSLGALKAVSLPWFALTLWLITAHLRAHAGRFGVSARSLVPLLFVAHPLVVDYAFTFRPELCLAALGLGSFMLLDRGLARNSTGPVLLAAALAGLAVLVHLNGLIFVVAGFVALSVAGVPRRALSFLCLALVISSLYAADALLAGEWQTLLSQLQNDPALEQRDFELSGALYKLLEEPRRWILHGEEVATTLLVVSAVLLARGRIWRAQRPLAVYTIAAVLTLALISQGKTPKYLVPLLPMLFLLVGVGMAELELRGRSLKLSGSLVLLACLVLFAARSQRYFSVNFDVAGRHAELLAGIPAGSAVVADLTFVFDEIESQDLRGLWAYRVEAEARGCDFDLTWLLQRSREDGARFVVLDLRRQLPGRLASEWPALAGSGLARECPAGGPDALVLALGGSD